MTAAPSNFKRWWRRAAALVAVALAVSAANGAERYQVEELPSRHLRGNRTIRVYLPPSYLAETKRHFPVLYLHDGQNVFSFAGTNIAFGWGNWELDRTADRLVREGRMREVILVGIDNSPDRFAEYGGSHRLPGAVTNTSFENYEAFLIEELKPHIDRTLRTLPDPASTGVMGSSLGGICSVVLAWDRPPGRIRSRRQSVRGVSREYEFSRGVAYVRGQAQGDAALLRFRDGGLHGRR